MLKFQWRDEPDERDELRELLSLLLLLRLLLRPLLLSLLLLPRVETELDELRVLLLLFVEERSEVLEFDLEVVAAGLEALLVPVLTLVELKSERRLLL